jgi:hypothetical protein
VPIKVAFEHPLFTNWAFAMGAVLKASAVTAAIAKVLAMLHFMIISFAFINCLHSGRRSF